MAGGIAPEIIPNTDNLFCRVHRAQYNFKEGRPSRAVFGKREQSVDWEKYSTPEQAVARFKGNPSDMLGVAIIKAGDCRALSLEVLHVPLGPDYLHGPNDAHSEIRGEKTPQIQSQLRDLASFWPKLGNH